MRLGVDPRKADQMVRGVVNLPHGTGKIARVIVFAQGAKAEEAVAAGADEVGTDELVARIQGGWLDFDAAIATPDQMAKIGRIARILGPRGLMPNPKTGTVTMDVTKAVNDIKGGKITFRVDKHSNLHLIIGKASFSEPSSWSTTTPRCSTRSCGPSRPPPRASTSRRSPSATTMGPGVPVDPNVVKNLRGERRRLIGRSLARRGPRGHPGGSFCGRLAAVRFDQVWFRYARRAGWTLRAVDATVEPGRHGRRAGPQRRRQVHPAPAGRRRAAPGPRRGPRPARRSSAGCPSGSPPTSRSPPGSTCAGWPRCAACREPRRRGRPLDRAPRPRPSTATPAWPTSPRAPRRRSAWPRPCWSRPACWCSTSPGRASTPSPAP